MLLQALFDKQAEYFDVNVVNETRNNTYSRLSKLAGSVGIDEKKIYSLLEISDKPGPDGSLNSGNKVTNDIKLLTKANRLTGVHVTPTVLFNVSENSGPILLEAHTDFLAGRRGRRNLERFFQGRLAAVVGEECRVTW